MQGRASPALLGIGLNANKALPQQQGMQRRPGRNVRVGFGLFGLIKDID